MTELARIEHPEYTRADFDRDADAVATAEATREAVAERVRQWDRGNSIDMARRVARMRDSDHWRGPGTKDSDREFYEWIVARGTLNSTGWAQNLLEAGRVLPVLDAAAEKKAIAYFPVGAAQIKRLGSKWYLAHPRSVVNVWTAAVEEANGQPSAELVAAKARRHKADLESVEDTSRHSAGQRAIHRKLRRMHKQLVGMYRDEPAFVDAWMRELPMSVRAEARES
jgi:hypothetical protein